MHETATPNAWHAYQQKLAQQWANQNNHQLQSLGIKLYNSQAGESVDQFLIGTNTGSSVFDNNFSITGSYLNNIPRKDLLAELYKRIYHNLPLFLNIGKICM